MKNIKEFSPLSGENILTQIEGNAWSNSPNPIVQLINTVRRLIWAILGVKKCTYIIATDMRIVQVDKKTLLWGLLPGSVDVMTLNKSTIQSVGYSMASSWFIFRKYYFVLANRSGQLRLTYKGKNKDLIEACSIVDSIVAQK